MAVLSELGGILVLKEEQTTELEASRWKRCCGFTSRIALARVLLTTEVRRSSPPGSDGRLMLPLGPVRGLARWLIGLLWMRYGESSSKHLSNFLWMGLPFGKHFVRVLSLTDMWNKSNSSGKRSIRCARLENLYNLHLDRLWAKQVSWATIPPASRWLVPSSFTSHIVSDKT